MGDNFNFKPLVSGQSQNNIQAKPQSDLTYLQPIVKEKKLWNMNYVKAAFVLGASAIILQFVIMTLFNLGPIGSWILAFILLLLYAISLYFLLEPKMLKEVTQPILKTEKVVQTIPVEKPVEVIRRVQSPPIIRTIEKPVYVQKRIYIEKRRKKLNIPKYDYVGSSLTKTYHAKTCRLAKSIKRKYKINSNSLSFFKKRKYSACKACILKTKKV